MTTIIGFDAEWDQPFSTDPNRRNRVLSYQYSVLHSGNQCSGIVYTKGPDPKDRLTFDQLIGEAILDARAKQVLPREWPTEIVAVAHFARADLAALADFPKLGAQFDAIRGTLVTRQWPYKATVTDKSRNQHKLDVHLSDTILLAPGKSSLRAIGELHGFPKIDLPSGAIEKMGNLLQNDQALFERYAIRDAEIAVAHASSIFDLATNGMGLERTPLTLSQLGVAHLRSVWEAKGWDELGILGKEKRTGKVYDKKRNRYRTQTTQTFMTRVQRYEDLAISCLPRGAQRGVPFWLQRRPDMVRLRPSQRLHHSYGSHSNAGLG